jgi:hypothetical protein
MIYRWTTVFIQDKYGNREYGQETDSTVPIIQITADLFWIFPNFPLVFAVDLHEIRCRPGQEFPLRFTSLSTLLICPLVKINKILELRD